MNRIPFSGSVISVIGETVFKEVSGWFVIRQRGAYSSWSGEFTIQSGEVPDMTDDAFVLVDGSGRRLGFIIVVRADAGVIEFMGAATSPPPDEPGPGKT